MAQAAILHIEGDRLRMPADAWEHFGFRRWVTSNGFPEQGVRASFVEGEVFLDMSPESIESHNKVKTEITAELARIVRDENLGELYSDRTLLTNIAVGLSTEPDALFASWATLESSRLRLVPKGNRSDEYFELEGAPDLVVEIVSDSSETKDLKRLRIAYARAGIAEYWIVDARAGEIKFEILALGKDGYDAPTGPVQPSRVLARSFALKRERNRVGRWRYQLEVL